MKKFKKFLAVLAASAMMLSCFTGCGNSADAGKKKIGVIAMVENGAFMDMKAGILDEMAANGYTDETAIIDYKCASGDATTLSSIVNNMTDGSYDLIFTIATPPTQAVVNTGTTTPVFFCAVSAPVAAGVISDMDAAPDKNATGTSNAIPVSDIVNFAQSTTPATKYGLIYSGNEDNATNTIEQAKVYLDSINMPYEVATAPTSADVESATNALISQGVDVIFVPNDSIIQDGISTLVALCRENKIPTYCSSATTVKSGCFATLAIDDHGIGEKTADMALEYLNGKALTDINSKVIGVDYCSINKETMEALGIEESSIVTDYSINIME